MPMNRAGALRRGGGGRLAPLVLGGEAARACAAGLAWKLTSLTLGAYLGALENVQAPSIRLPLGQIAANEAQQLGALAHLVGRQAIGRAFAAALPIDVVSAALDDYES